MEAVVEGRRPLSATAFELRLSRPGDFSFSAGQRIRLTVNEGAREYSLASGPAEESLSLCVRQVPEGAVSSALAEAPRGTSIPFTGPHGLFTYALSPRPPVFVATGVGIAPFLSMVRSGVHGFTLLQGAGTREELFYRSELEGSARLYAPCLSREEADGCFHGRVTEWMSAHLAAGAYDFYLCGGRRMVRDITLLVDERFPDSRVFTEIFF